jgi:hypothetical protein
MMLTYVFRVEARMTGLDPNAERSDTGVGHLPERDPLRGLDVGVLGEQQPAQSLLGAVGRKLAVRCVAALGPRLAQNPGRVLANDPVAADPHGLAPRTAVVVLGEPD